MNHRHYKQAFTKLTLLLLLLFHTRAFNPQRAKKQNITVGVSFGATRELAFVHASAIDDSVNDKVRLSFPQTNNGVFSFGRDVNIRWKHGINALPEEQQDGKGRVSIILWGLAQNVAEEENSPPLLGSDGRGPHANRNYHKRHRPEHRRGSRDMDDHRPHHKKHRRR